MSVYTIIEPEHLIELLSHYDLGELLDYQGISDGIENTNYFVHTSTGKYVLTIFEELTASELPYFLNVMAFLAEHQVPSAHPIANQAGVYLQTLKSKPTAIVQCLEGSSVRFPNQTQCQAIGCGLGKFHAVSQQFTDFRANQRGPHWWRITIDKLLPHLPENDAQLLENEIHIQSQYRFSELPRGVVHADLFRDNALFVGNRLTGMIDFYHACNDVLLYDVAVTVNDWCTLTDGSFEQTKLKGLLLAYQKQRQLQTVELKAWPIMLRAAALRFWLSRLNDMYFPRAGELTHIKDPNVFKQILQHRIEHPPSLDFLE